MADVFHSHPSSFGDLLGRYTTSRLAVPQFQRGYSWEKEHVATFWDDLLTFHKVARLLHVWVPDQRALLEAESGKGPLIPLQSALTLSPVVD